MPFSTFEELSDEIIRYTHRGDLDLRIPDFIILAEKEMFNNPVEQLAIKYLEKTSTAPTTTTSRFIALPDDYESLRSSRLAIDNESDFRSYFTPVNAEHPEMHGGFASCYFADEDDLEPLLKELKVTIRCVPLGTDDGPGTCFLTGKQAEKRAIFAKAY